MKRSIKTIRTIATISIALVGSYLLGTAQAKTAPKTINETQTVSETEKTASETTPHSQQRIITGNYYDYMVIETRDGNAWLLDDTEESPYIENNVAIFEDGELVQVVFDTMGTEAVTDDVIINVRSIDRRHK